MSKPQHVHIQTPHSLGLSPKAYCLLAAIAAAVDDDQNAIYKGSPESLWRKANLGSKHSYHKARNELINKGFIDSENDYESKGASTIRTVFGVRLLKPFLFIIDRREGSSIYRKKHQNGYSESMADIEEAVLSQDTDDFEKSFCRGRSLQIGATETLSCCEDDPLSDRLDQGGEFWDL